MSKNFKLIKDALRDLRILYFPKKSVDKSFAFLIHPRDMYDVAVKYPIVRYFPDKLVEIFLEYIFWPVTASHIDGVTNKKTGEKVTGIIISIPMTASQMLTNRTQALKQIKKAVRLAKNVGATHIGLGALTASLARGGLDLVAEAETVILTNGKLYTANTVANIAIDISDMLSFDKSSVVVAVVGAAGSIGSATAQILARNGFKNFMLIDLSDKQTKVESIKSLLKNIGGSDVNVELKNTLDELKNTDLIIAATNRPDALIRSEHLKPGSVVVDDAQPSDVDPSVIESRGDVLILEGGVVHTDDIYMNIKTGLKHKTDIFSCLAEVILLAHTESSEQSVGEVVELNFNTLELLQKHADTLGFRRGVFQNFKKVYTTEEIQSVRKSRA